MTLITLGNDLSIYLLCPFLTPAFMLLALSCLELFDNNTKNGNKFDTLMLFFLYLSMILNGIFELFTTTSSKSKDADLNMSISVERSSDTESKFTVSKRTKVYFKNIVIPIGICAFFDIAGYYLIIYATILSKEPMYEYIDSEVLIIQMVFISIISKLILKYQIYMHQKVSICLSIIGMLFIFPSTVLAYKDKFSWQIILLFFSSISFSIAIVYEKFIMQTKGVSPYKLLFYKGIIGSVINLIYIIINEWIVNNNYHIFSIFSDFKFLFAIPFLLFGFAYSLCYVLTNYHFTPCHTGLCDVISSIAGWISLSMETGLLKINDNFKITFHICHIIGYIFIGLSVVIYNEIVIFYVCGMEKDTKGFIIQRGSRDTNEAIEAQRINNIDENQEELLQADTPTPDDCDGSYTSN